MINNIIRFTYYLLIGSTEPSSVRIKTVWLFSKISFIEFSLFLFSAFTPPVWFQCFISFNHLLLIINASCNFLIYVSVGDKFKTTIENFCQSSLGCKACWIKRNHSAASPLGNDTEENGKSMPLLQVSSKHRNGKNNESIRTQIGNLEHTQVKTKQK